MKTDWKPALLAALILLPLESGAAIYKCQGADGSTLYADTPCGPNAQTQAPMQTQVQLPGSHTSPPLRVAPPIVTAPSARLLRSPAPGGIAPGEADGIDAYLSDAHLLESRQDTTPLAPIRYADPLNGALLKRVLNPARASTLLEAAIRQRSTHQFDALRNLLGPMQQRYAQAFAGNPRRYEAEYLDTLDINAATTRVTGAMLRNPPPAPTASMTAADAKLAQSLASLNQGMGGMLTAAAQMMAKGIRQQVASGKFTPAGAQRATDIANSLAPGAS